MVLSAKAARLKGLLDTLTKQGQSGSARANKLRSLLGTLSGPGVEGAPGGGTRPSSPKKASALKRASGTRAKGGYPSGDLKAGRGKKKPKVGGKAMRKRTTTTPASGKLPRGVKKTTMPPHYPKRTTTTPASGKLPLRRRKATGPKPRAKARARSTRMARRRRY